MITPFDDFISKTVMHSQDADERLRGLERRDSAPRYLPRQMLPYGTLGANGYTVTPYDCYIGCCGGTAGKGGTIQLPGPGTPGMGAGRLVIIKDESGSASSYPILIEGTASQTFDGIGSVTINVNYGGVGLVSNGTAWQVAFRTPPVTHGSAVFGDDIRTAGGVYVGGTVTDAATGDVVATADGRFGGGLYVGSTAVDPAAGALYVRQDNDLSYITGNLQLLKARAAGANVAAGDWVGGIYFRGMNAGVTENAATIRAEVDGTPCDAANDMPGRLILATSPDGSATVVDRVGIYSTGAVRVLYSLHVGDLATSAADNDLQVVNDGRFGGGLYVGSTATDPATNTITIGSTGDYHQLFFMKTNALNTFRSCAWSKRNDTYFGNVANGFVLECDYFGAAAHDHYVVPIIFNPNGDILLASASNATNGKVGINDTAPGEILDVGGNVNATGVYKIDDVQVVSNRVIDARCDDVINSGDATTDGVIDSLRDCLISHGLLAAA